MSQIGEEKGLALLLRVQEYHSAREFRRDRAPEDINANEAIAGLRRIIERESNKKNQSFGF